jgi:hypothetical protein
MYGASPPFPTGIDDVLTKHKDHMHFIEKKNIYSSALSQSLLQTRITSFFICNFNQQSEFTFYKLMLCLLQCLEGESSSGESPVPQIRSIGQLLLSRLFSSLTSTVLRSGFSWVSSVV